MDTERYVTSLKRLKAAIVDTIVFMPLLLIGQWIFSHTSNENILICWVIFTNLAPLIYAVLLNFKYGQTIGKWAAGVKIVDYTETRTITLKQSLLRVSFYIVLEGCALFYFTFLALRDGDINHLIKGYSDFAFFPMLIWASLDIIVMLTNAKKRAIHDFLAKSVVIRT